MSMFFRYFFVFIILFLSFGQLAKIGTFYIVDLFIFLYVLASLIYLLSIKKLLTNKTYAFFIIFLFFGILGVFVNFYKYTTSELINGFFYALRYFFYLLLGICTYNFYKLKIFTFSFIKKTLVLNFLLLFVFGIVQLILYPDISLLDVSLGWDPHKNRMVSSLLDPNFLGHFYFIVFSFLFLQDKKSKSDKFILALVGVGLFLTFSRSTWLMVFVFLFFYGLKNHFKVILISLLVAFFAYFLVPRVQTRLSGITDPNDSASLRVVSWTNSLRLIQKNFLFGVGFNMFKYAQIDGGFIDYLEVDEHSVTGSDSSILFAFAVSGVFGGVFYLLGLLSIENKTIFVPIIIGSFFINSLFYPLIMFWLFSLMSFRIEE